MEIVEHDSPLGHYDASNPYILPSSKKKKDKNREEPATADKSMTKRGKGKLITKTKSPKLLSKKQRRRLQQIVDRRKRKANRSELLEELRKHELSKEVYDKFVPLVQVQSKTVDKKLKKIKKMSENSVDKEDAAENDNDQSVSWEDDDEDVNESWILKRIPQTIPCPTPAAPLLPPSKPPKLAIDKKASKIPVSLIPRPHNFVPVHRKPEIETSRQKLPIVAEEQIIMESINENIITILSSETGSGKTTQIPQFLYEAGYATGDKIIGKLKLITIMILY